MRIVYFAWLRTRVGRAAEEVEPPADVTTVGALMQWLALDRPGLAAALEAEGVVRCAVNQHYAEHDHPVRAGDEIALFPPVTGG